MNTELKNLINKQDEFHKVKEEYEHYYELLSLRCLEIFQDT